MPMPGYLDVIGCPGVPDGITTSAATNSIVSDQLGDDSSLSSPAVAFARWGRSAEGLLLGLIAIMS